jgi:hypothetical protein
MKTIKFVVTVLAIISIVGCAGQTKKLPGKLMLKEGGDLVDAYISNTTVGDTLDRSTSVTQISVDSGLKDDKGKPILKQISLETNTSGTVAGRTIEGVTSGMGAAWVQGEYLQKVAKNHRKASRCPDGTQVCNSTILQSMSDSNANAGVDVVTDIVLGGCDECDEFD